MSRASRTITVLVGTDCHPFKRIIDWADRWAQANPSDRVIVQYGHSTPPRIAAGRDFVPPRELATLLETSEIVILHGGPATISEARKAGHLPLVFPRDPQYGEHVDDHQQRFTRWSAERGLAICVEAAQELDAHVAAAAENEAGTRLLIEAENFGADEVAQKLAALLHKRRTSTNRASVGAPVVLYVAAPANSVDALLESVGGRVPVAVLGDTRNVWQRGIIDNEDCSCGVPFHECGFWRAVGKSAFGGWDEVDVRHLAGLADAVRQARTSMPAALTGRREGRQALARYSGYYQAIYSAARDVSGADVLVDSGQDPVLAYALSHNREIDLRLLEVATTATFWSRARSAATQDKPSWLSATRAAPTLSRHIPRASLPPSAVGDKPVVACAWTELGLPAGSAGEGADGAVGLVSQATGPVPNMAARHAVAAPRDSAARRPVAGRSGVAGFGTAAGAVRMEW